MRRIMLVASVCASALIGAAITSTAAAESFRVGRLVCTSSPRVGLVLGSAQELRCVFAASRPPRQYVYEGRIRRVGLDLGVTSAGSLSWAVFALFQGQSPVGALLRNYRAIPRAVVALPHCRGGPSALGDSEADGVETAAPAQAGLPA